MIAAVALSSFVFLEMHQRLPMLDLSLFRNGTFAGANIVAILVTLAMFGIFVFFPIYMQTFRGWSPIQAGRRAAAVDVDDRHLRADRREARRTASARAG